MKVAGKIVARLMVMIIVTWNCSPLYAQAANFFFHPDGTMTIESKDQSGLSIHRFDDQMRLIEALHYFADGKRMKMFDKYRYENNMMVERIAYLYTQGYERESYQFNAKGYQTEYRHYTSQTEGNWVEDDFRISGYDERNNVNYFRSKGSRSDFSVNILIRTNYDYVNRTRAGIEYEFDANDREISSHSFRSGLADWHFESPDVFEFDINKHAPNLRPNRVVKWEGSDKNGNRVEKVFVDHEAVTRTFDDAGRVIHIGFGTHNFDDSHVKCEETYRVLGDFNYDRQGRLIQSEIKFYSDALEKTVFEHGKNIVAKRYRQNSNGSWKQINTKNYNDIDIFTPPVRGSVHQNAAASSVNQNEPSWEPAPATTSVPPQTSRPATTQSLANDINALNIESNEGATTNAYAMDAERLSHIADVLSHATGVKISEEQVLALAMQLLIQNYNADLREMNNQYLKDKVSVFD